VHPTPDRGSGDHLSIHRVVEDLLGERIEALAAWIQELDARVRATSAAADEKSLKELRRALEAWSKRDPKFEERLTNRVDVLADRLATLSSTVNTTAAALTGNEGEIAALRRQLEDGTSRVEAALRDVPRVSAGSADTEELRRMISELAAELPSRKGDKQVDGLSEKIANLGERLDTLAKTVATTAAGLAGRDGELVALRRALEDEHGHIEDVVADFREADRHALGEIETRVQSLARTVEAVTNGSAGKERQVAELRRGLDVERAKGDAVSGELRASVESLASRIVTLEGAVRADTTDLLEQRLESLATFVDRLGARVETVAAGVESASSSFADQELELAALHRQFSDAGSRVEAVLDELRRTIEALPDSGTADAELDGRLEQMVARIDTLANRLADADAVSSARIAHADARTAELEHALSDVARRLEAVVEALSTRLDVVEREREAAVAEVQSTHEAWAAEKDALEARVAEMAAAVADHASSEADLSESLLAETRGRLEALERESSAGASETARTGAFVASALESLEARLEEVASRAVPPSEDEELERLLVAFADRIDALDRDRATIVAEAARAAGRELEQLRVRQASTEKEIAALAGSRDVVAAIEELTSRVEAIEWGEGALIPPTSPPVAGEGRFRVEFRALELRIEHAEEAARESREAVLVELERLASRVERRLQRLESAETDTEVQEAGAGDTIGRVVPIRGGAET
jgi:predicted  nucleic acid-binding Zn-ribbon protein